MSRFGLIAGDKTSIMQKEVNKNNSIKIDTIWNNTLQLAMELETMPVQIIDSMESILVVDTGLPTKKSVDEAAKAFLQLEDVMNAKNFSHVKLYLLTKDPSLYNKLKGNINGMEGMFYKNAEMFLIESSLSIPYIIQILQGQLDKTGVYSSKRDEMTKIERLEREQKALVEDAQRVSKESLDYGKTEPISEINQEEVLGSKKHKELQEKREFEERKLERTNESLRKKNEKNKVKNKNKGTTLPSKQTTPSKNKGKDVEIIIDSGSGSAIEPVPNHTSNPVKNTDKTVYNDKSLDKDYYVEFKDKPLIERNINISKATTGMVPSNAELTELFNRLNQTDNSTIEKKLQADKGVISFVGERGSGVSGIVAQTAEVYAMLGQKVLIIDLDVMLSSQTMYYPTYSEAVADFKGESNSIIRITQVNDVEKNAVPVTSRINMLSNEKSNATIDDGFHATITNIFNVILEDATQEHDIVLIDIPLEYLTYYIRHFDRIDKNVFVSENKFYTIEDFFSIKLQRVIDNDLFSNELISKSSLILNKFRTDYRDREGIQMNRFKVKEMLLDAGTPYDRIPVIGEIPFYPDWEEQYYTKTRYIWTDDIALGIYRNIVSKIL